MISVVFDLNARVALSHFPLAAMRRGLAHAQRSLRLLPTDPLPATNTSSTVVSLAITAIDGFASLPVSDQFLCMAFAQLTYRGSLRGIEICLCALQKKLYHAGFRGVIARSTLCRCQLNTATGRIYADFAQVLIAHARRLYQADGFGAELEQPAYALDSTTIDLCLTLFPGAHFRRRKGAIGLHTLIDLRGNIPCLVRITHGKTHDVTILDILPIEPGAFYVMDRAYLDFDRLHRLTTGLAFFVTRAKSNLDFSRCARLAAWTRPRDCGSDQTIVLCGPKTSKFTPTRCVACGLPRRQDGQAVRVLEQQLRFACIEDCEHLQMSLAGRIVLLMDQAAFENQVVLWDFAERCEDASLDCDLHLCVGGHHSQG